MSPGRCCKSLTLSGGPMNDDREAVEGGRPTYLDALNYVRKNGVPFVPLRPQQTARGEWVWRYACPKLGDDGRCTIYDDRPDLCRRFEPGGNDLCVHSQGTTSGDASALVELPPKYYPANEVIDNEASWTP